MSDITFSKICDWDREGGSFFEKLGSEIEIGIQKFQKKKY